MSWDYFGALLRNAKQDAIDFPTYILMHAVWTGIKTSLGPASLVDAVKHLLPRSGEIKATNQPAAHNVK